MTVLCCVVRAPLRVRLPGGGSHQNSSCFDASIRALPSRFDASMFAFGSAAKTVAVCSVRHQHQASQSKRLALGVFPASDRSMHPCCLSVDLPCRRYITFSAGLSSLEIYAARVCDELGSLDRKRAVEWGRQTMRRARSIAQPQPMWFVACSHFVLPSMCRLLLPCAIIIQVWRSKRPQDMCVLARSLAAVAWVLVQMAK